MQDDPCAHAALVQFESALKSLAATTPAEAGVGAGTLGGVAVHGALTARYHLLAGNASWEMGGEARWASGSVTWHVGRGGSAWCTHKASFHVGGYGEAMYGGLYLMLRPHGHAQR